MRVLIWLWVLLFPLCALGEFAIEPSAPVVQVGEVIDFSVQDAQAELLQYHLTRNGQTVAESEPCAYASVSYVPRQAGLYELTVTQGDGQASAACTFTAVESLQCRLIVDATAGEAGEPFTFSVEVPNDSAYCYTYEVYMGPALILRQESTEPTFTYIPRQAGRIRVTVIAEDANGHRCESSASVDVKEGAAIRLTGDSTVFPQQGDIRTYTVEAPGVWYAVSECDFVTLLNDCGLPGGSITLAVEGGVSVDREGLLRLYSDGCEASLRIRQHPENGLEEESFFSPITDTLLVNGSTQTTLMDAVGQRILRVDASGAWAAQCDADFVTINQSSNALYLTIEPNDTPAIRSALVTLTCGDATAYVHLFQPPVAMGSQVLDIRLPQSQGTAYQDSAAVQVITTPDTRMLTLYTPGLEPSLSFSCEEAQSTPQGLCFDLSIPLNRAGFQPFFVVAEDEQDSSLPKGGLLNAAPEAPAFVSSTASMVVTDQQAVITVTTTASADEIEILNAAGDVIDVCFRADTPVDLCSLEPAGRFAEWTLTLPADLHASALRLGDALCRLEISHLPAKPFTVYSQFDGRWKDAPYRKSNLEQSGCAVFALSHALERLGYTGSAILPQSLAEKYYFALLEGGTVNSTLVGHAGDDLGFKTRYELYTRLSAIRDKMAQGALFSFSVANGHIAMVAGISENGQKFRIVDSAPSATFERIKNTALYREENGQFIPINDLSELPGIRYYFETNAFGGAEYWLDAPYGAKRGLRLIQPR